jgi:hypothetical protein
VHPFLRDAIEDSRSDLELTGTVTDGDDHDWVGDSAVLGGNGNWREVLAGPSERLLKRKFDEMGDDANGLFGDEEEAVVYSVVDDPDDEQVRILFLSTFILILNDSSCFRTYKLNDEIELLLQRADDMAIAIDIIHQQVKFKDKLWIHQMVVKGLARDVSALVNDTRWLEQTGRSRTTTWARNAQERHRASNLMGYHQSSSPPRSPSPAVVENYTAHQENIRAPRAATPTFAGTA